MNEAGDGGTHKFGESAGSSKPGRATEVSDALRAKELSAEELERRHPTLPELRLRPDISVAVDDAAAAGLVERLSTEGARSMYVQSGGDGHAGFDAVLVPVSRYLDLVGQSLMYGNDFEVQLDGRMIPRSLAGADVEPANPDASWAKAVMGPGPQSDLRLPPDA